MNDKPKPLVIVIGGTNGPGKTTITITNRVKSEKIEVADEKKWRI